VVERFCGFTEPFSVAVVVVMVSTEFVVAVGEPTTAKVKTLLVLTDAASVTLIVNS
jgi:hypothetical protein